MSLTDPQVWISLVTLSLLEIVLGVDNIIFISIVAGKLPHAQQARGRLIGLALALITRILLLCSIYWLTRLIDPLFYLGKTGYSGKDLVLFFGGLFLIWKSGREIISEVRGEHHDPTGLKGRASFATVITQIVLIDIVFSLDSVITAVGLAQHLPVMIAAVVVAMIVMMVASGTIADFVNKHPTVKMLALAFLVLVGLVLMVDGLHFHVEKTYVYFAMAFSFTVELLNLKMRARRRKLEKERVAQEKLAALDPAGAPAAP